MGDLGQDVPCVQALELDLEGGAPPPARLRPSASFAKNCKPWSTMTEAGRQCRAMPSCRTSIVLEAVASPDGAKCGYEARGVVPARAMRRRPQRILARAPAKTAGRIGPRPPPPPRPPTRT